MTKISEYLEKMKVDTRNAIELCAREDIRAELGYRANEIHSDLEALLDLGVDSILTLDTNRYAYFRGPNPHDNFYDSAAPLLSMMLSIFTQLNGLVYAAGQSEKGNL